MINEFDIFLNYMLNLISMLYRYIQLFTKNIFGTILSQLKGVSQYFCNFLFDFAKNKLVIIALVLNSNLAHRKHRVVYKFNNLDHYGWPNVAWLLFVMLSSNIRVAFKILAKSLKSFKELFIKNKTLCIIFAAKF